jgi:hypothetical protein
LVKIAHPVGVTESGCITEANAVSGDFQSPANENPCGERYEVIEGKTPERSWSRTRALLAAIDTGNVVGLRERAIMALLIYTAARAGAAGWGPTRHGFASP